MIGFFLCPVVKLILMKYLLIVLLFVLTTCCWLPTFPPIEETNLTEIIITDSEFTMEWDSDIDYPEYNLYYKVHDTVSWVLLITVNTKEVLITEDMLLRGVYDFAVTSKYLDDESDKHTSLDDTAQPPGWYLNWAYIE